MRGFPLMNLLAVAGALLLLLIPLLRIDRPMAAVVSRPAADVAAGLPATVLLRFVHEPLTVSLERGGEAVELVGTGLGRQAETTLTASDRSVELSIRATWAPGVAGSVVEVKVAPEALAEQQQNVWTDGAAVDEILRFNWREKP